MAQNLFSIKDQSELNSIIHRSKTACDGGKDCDWCSKFHRTSELVETVTAKGSTITLTKNEKVVGTKGRYLAWCESCSDGEHASFWDACDWAKHHIAKRHTN